MKPNEDLVKHLYDRFNARDIDGVLALVSDDVAWANGMEGGHVDGRDAVRAYWTRQWSTIDPRVDPVNIREAADGSTLVDVHQVVRDLEGRLLLDETVVHAFRIEEGRVLRFDIRSTSQLSAVKHYRQGRVNVRRLLRIARRDTVAAHEALIAVEHANDQPDREVGVDQRLAQFVDLRREVEGRLLRGWVSVDQRHA